MHVITYQLVDADYDQRPHHKMALALDEFGASKKKHINTLWTVPSSGRDSTAIRKEIKRLVVDHDIPAERVHLWVAKYDPSDVAYGWFEIKD